jgi:putative CRISPR-associated protein (TIGR02619 family)
MQRRHIICTAGTSVKPANVKFDESQKGLYRDAIRSRMSELEKTCASRREFREKISAEIKSLEFLKVNGDDAVYLLHTDTEDGKICAEFISDIALAEFGVACQLKKILGLQVTDADRFRKVGIDNLFKTLKEITAEIEHDPDQKVILNVTGGFKSVVPYITIFGLMHRFDVSYVFEYSPSLITMPPIPVQFDFERMGRAAGAIDKLRTEGVAKQDSFFSWIPDLPFPERKWFECLLEVDEQDNVTLSALAEQLLFAREEDKTQIMLSGSAKKELNSVDGIDRELLEILLLKLKDPMWRKQKIHSFSGTDLSVYKPGNTGHRAAGFLKGNTFYVCELFHSHDKYESSLKGKKRKDYALPEFISWNPGSEDSASIQEELVTELLKGELASCKAKLDETENKLEKAAAETRKIKDQLQTRKELSDIQINELTSKVNSLTEENGKLKSTEKPLQSDSVIVSIWKRLFGRK